GLPPYTDTAGKGKVRVGKDCQPLTGTMRRRILVETGENDFTAEEVPEPVEAILSPAALEALRDVACQEKAPPDLLAAGDLDILGALGVLRGGRLNRAGLLLAGRSLAIERHVPNHLWTHLRMQSETDYQDRADGRDALPIALTHMTDRIMANNPITTLAYGLFHFEYRTYPELALREALLNALCHRDFRLGGPVIVKQLPGRLEIGNPGGFIGGITPENILHHLPVARNPALVDALTQLRLVNRSNLGIQRMFSAMLIEGKAPPRVEEQGDAVVIVLRAAPLSAPLRAFVAEENGRGRLLSVDHLLVLRHLLGHPELSTPEAARLCQRAEPEARELLGQMEREFGYLERGGTGRGTYWRLNHSLHHRLAGPGQPERDQRIEWETAKTRLLDILRQRSERGGPGLSNEEARAATLLDRRQIKRLLSELRDEGHVRLVGRGRYARWVFAAPGQ
ncbi:MAG: AAA family ATPase, partial [Deltaproteobacteria bacterium]|nr:AAA family ATPase [Deltaproteobacteria bacterium]